MKTKPLVPKVAEFQAHKAWINELYEYSGDSIRQKKTVTAHTSVLTRTKWLIDEARRLTAPLGGIDKDMEKVAKFFDTAVVEQEKSIKGGQFIRLNAGLFKTIRWVVRELETIILATLDEDEAMLLRASRTATENVGRATLDATELLGVDDDEEEDDDEATTTEKRKTEDLPV